MKGIFFGCSNPRFGGCGSVLDVFTEGHVSRGHRDEEAVALLKEFYKGENPNAPPEKRKPARQGGLRSQN